MSRIPDSSVSGSCTCSRRRFTKALLRVRVDISADPRVNLWRHHHLFQTMSSPLVAVSLAAFIGRCGDHHQTSKRAVASRVSRQMM